MFSTVTPRSGRGPAPAKAGVQGPQKNWMPAPVPAYAGIPGMTIECEFSAESEWLQGTAR